jgi:hypothetical protein
MRGEADRERVLELVRGIGKAARGPGRVYLVGGSSVVLLGGSRATTVDVDLKLNPEPPGVFEPIASLKDSVGGNVELAAPDRFRRTVELFCSPGDDGRL